MFDYHIHTSFSEDSQMPPETACRRALERGLQEIAITDHMDFDWPIKPYHFEIEDLDLYFKTLLGLKQAYAKRLTLKLGIEMGLRPHTLEASAGLIKRYPLDYIIASIHIVDGMDPYLPEYYKDRDKVKSYTDYYEEIFTSIGAYDGFSVLGHLDYLRRYCVYPYESNDHLIGIDIVEAILKRLIDKGKGLELNTSGYRHTSGQPLPHPDILKLYKRLGGEILTLGSDAHVPEFIGFQFSHAIEVMKNCGFSYLTSYTGLKPNFIKID